MILYASSVLMQISAGF